MNLKFEYGVMGNRVAKHVHTSADEWLYSFEYIHDAQGNIMAIYKEWMNHDTQERHSARVEANMWGSDFIGVNKEIIELIGAPPVDTTEYTRTLGYKQYSLKNHLGNVLTTVSNKKIAVDADEDGIIDYWKANIISATDYGIFGENLKTRTFNAAAYPNSFNDKRDLVELDGWQDYGFRNYMKPERRFERVDPLFHVYPFYSPYHYASNTPIAAVDEDGLEADVKFNTIERSDRKAAKALYPGNEEKQRDYIRGNQRARAYGVLAGGAVVLTVLTAGEIIPLLARAALWLQANQLTIGAVGAFGVGIFDEAGQVQLPGGFDETGRAMTLTAKQFLNKNTAKLFKKLGNKIGGGKLPFEKSKEGVEKAIDIVKKTLGNPTASAEIKETAQGKLNVIDIFSAETGFTVRVNKKTGDFVTLIDEATPAIKEAIKNANK